MFLFGCMIALVGASFAGQAAVAEKPWRWFGISLVLLLISVITIISAASAQTYNFTGLSTDDVLTIGRALDKLPREDTDRGQLYQRIQAQITQQANAMAKAKADADKAALDKAIAEAIEKTKTEEKPQ